MVKSRGKAKTGASRSFYVVLALIAVAGVAVLGYVLSRPRTDAVTMVDPGGPLPEARGYLLGSAEAPVQILEFADFECPACADFAVITEPDVRKRLVETGRASYRFFDFPLPMHRNSWNASHAAACADEQGRFWEMHDMIFRQQGQWAPTRSPRGIFQTIARQLGLDVQQWEACYDSRKYQRQIEANKAEGERRGVQATPTFIIGNRMIAGSIPYDRLRAYVDSAAAEGVSSVPGLQPPIGLRSPVR